MKYSSQDISEMFLSLSNKNNVSGHVWTSGISSSGFVPIWSSFAWYFVEDQRYGVKCEDYPPGALVLPEDC